MRIQTTINLHRHQVSRLAAVCEKYALSRSELIALLVSRFLKKQRLACSIFRCVRYQRRNNKIFWRIVHVSFREDLFEKCCDIRKCCKFSVSFLIAKAIELYLETIERELAEGSPDVTDNYCPHYVCIYTEDLENTHFHIYWSVAHWKEVEKKLEHQTR